VTIHGRHDLTALERLSLQITVSEVGCWVWGGGRTAKNGYGRFMVNGSKILVHIFTFEAFVRPVPDGLTLDHLCRNTLCANPSHLIPLDGSVNVLIGDAPPAKNARMEFCKRGHDALTWKIVNCNGRRILQRQCDECIKDKYTKGRFRRWLATQTRMSTSSNSVT
jgi:hypothetical protein